VRQRLRKHGFSEDEIGPAIRQAVDAGLIDDLTFARLWVEDRILHSPRSRRAVERELLEKGIDRVICQAAVQQHYPESRERELLWALASERFERLSRLDSETRARRTIGFLARRGFPPGGAARMIKQLETEQRQDMAQEANDE